MTQDAKKTPAPSSSACFPGRLWLRVPAFAAAYFALAMLGHFLDPEHGAFVNFWLPSGLFVAMLLRNATRHWPLFVLAAFPANIAFDLWNGQAVHISFLFCCGNCLEALGGAWLVRRFVAPRPTLSKVREVAGLVAFSAVLSTMLSALVGAAVVSGLLGAGDFVGTWLLWWSSDLLGVLLVAPPLLACPVDLRQVPPWRPARLYVEAAAFAAVLCCAAAYVFRDDLHPDLGLKYALIPLVFWAAFRFGVWGTALSTPAVAAIAAWCTVQGVSEFSAAVLTPEGQSTALQLYLAVTAMTGLSLAAALAERRRASRELVVAGELLRVVNASRSTRELIHAAVTFFRAQSGCEAVGVRLRDGDDYPYFEAQGFPPEFVLLENQLCARDPAGAVVRDNTGNPVIECMCGNVICGRFDPAKPFFTAHGSFWTNSTTELLASSTEADRQARTRNRCNGEGYESVALIPLHVGEERLGLLQLNDHRPGMFAAETVAFWERLAGYLAVGVAKLRSDEALRESQQRVQVVVEGTSDAVYLKDLQGRYLLFNRAAAGFVAKQPKDVLGRDDTFLFSPDEARSVMEGDRRVMAGGQTATYEEQVTTADGVLRTFFSTKGPIFDAAGNVVGLFGVARDITDRKRSEEALRESEANYRSLFENMTQGAFRQRADGAIVDANAAALRMFGLTSDELLGRTSLAPAWDVVGEDDVPLPGPQHPSMRALGSGEPVIGAVVGVVHAQTKSRVWLEVNAIPEFRPGEQKPSQVLVTLHDFTARKQAEDDLSRVLDLSPDMICVAAADGYFKQVNPAWKKTLGYTRRELLARPFAEFIHPDDLAPTMAEVQRQLAGQETINFVNRYRCKDGSYKWFEWVANPSPDGTLLFAAARDITDRRRAEEALRESEERFRTLVEQAGDGMELVDREGRYLDVNAATLAQLGYTREEMLRLAVFDVDPTVDRQRFAREIQLLASGVPLRLESVHRRKDGREFPVDITISAVRLRGQQCFLTLVRDVSARRQMDEALRRERDRAQRYLDTVEAVVVALDPEGRITLLNGKGCRLLGYGEGELIGQSWFSTCLPQPDGMEQVYPHFRRLIAGEVEAVEHFENPVRTRDGQLRQIAWHNAVLRDDQNRIVGTLSAGEDVTEQRQAQATLRESEARYRSLFDNMLNGYAYCRMIFEQDRPQDFVYLAVNRAFETLTGLKDVVGRRVSEVIPGIRESDPRIFEIYGRVAQSGTPESFEIFVEALQMWFAISVYGPGQDHFVAVFDVITGRKRAEEALRASEAEHRTLVQAMPDVVMRFDRDGRHLFVSDNVVDVTGIPPQEFIGRTHRELGFPRHLCDFWEDAIRRVFDGGSAHETEFSFPGERAPMTFNWRLVPECDAAGNVQSVLSISRDITAHREAERNYQTLFREMLDGFALHEILCDAQGKPCDYRFLAVNPAFERMTGLTAEAVVGKTVREVLPSTEPHWIDTYGRVALSGEPAFFENYHAGLDKHFQVTAFRPTANQFACIFADITERKRVEQALLENQTELQAIYDHAPVMMCVLDADRRVQYVNRALAAFVDKPQTELVHDRACGILGCVNALDDPRGCGFGPNCVHCPLRLAMLDTMQTGASRTGIEYRATLLRNHTSQEVILLGSTARIRSGGQDMLLLCLADITQFTRAEEERRNLEAQLLHAQKLESLGVLAGGIAHDFNNLLGAIVSNVDLAKQQLPADSPALPHVEQSLRAAARAADLTRQMLTYSGKGQLLVRRIHLSELVDENAHLLRVCISKEAELRLELCQDLPPVEADPGQLQQVVMNLITNAAEALNEQPGTVFLRTGATHCDEAALAASRVAEKPPAGEFVFLEVVDTGCGMDAETRQRLFDPFFTTKFTGRGLGMSAVLGIVRGHRGAIFVESAAGWGTTVRVLFPAAPAASGGSGPVEAADADPSRGDTPRLETGADATAAAGRDLPSPPSFAGTVLMADDDEMAREACQAVLATFGFEVLVAADGEEAVRIFRARADAIRCVVLDLTMPKMDGLAAFRAMRQIKPDVKVVLVSGYDEREAARQFGGGGPAGFVQKPYRLQTLAAEIRRVLQGP